MALTNVGCDDDGLINIMMQVENLLENEDCVLIGVFYKLSLFKDFDCKLHVDLWQLPIFEF